MTVHPRCVATVVARKAIDALLEASGSGSFKDEHPWLIAGELLDEARAAGSSLVLLFATDGPLAFSHWTTIETIEVLELHKGVWRTSVHFASLKPVNPIWSELGSVTLAPSAETLHRETVEPIRIFRQHLDETTIRPYAVCETPPFLLQAND